MSTAPGQSKGPDESPAFVEQDDKTTEPQRPAKNANKQEWVDYADARGLDSSGTVPGIIKRIDDADRESTSADESGSDEGSDEADVEGVHADAGNDGSTPILVPGPTKEAPIQAKQDRTVSPEAATAALNEETARQEAEKVRDLSGDDNGDGAGETEDEDDESTDSAFENLPLDKLPIASQVGDLLLRVEQNKAGIVVLTVSMFGYIGDIPISIRAEQAGDLEKAVADLRKQAQAAK